MGMQIQFQLTQVDRDYVKVTVLCDNPEDAAEDRTYTAVIEPKDECADSFSYIPPSHENQQKGASMWEDGTCWFDCGRATETQLARIKFLIRNRICFFGGLPIMDQAESNWSLLNRDAQQRRINAARAPLSMHDDVYAATKLHHACKAIDRYWNTRANNGSIGDMPLDQIVHECLTLAIAGVQLYWGINNWAQNIAGPEMVEMKKHISSKISEYINN